MTRLLPFLLLAGCTAEASLPQHEQAAVEQFVANECADDQAACEFSCRDEFWRPEAETHLNQCLLIVARKFMGEV